MVQGSSRQIIHGVQRGDKRLGHYGAVLPSIAAVEFERAQLMEFALPFPKTYARPICVAWNPRLTEVRPVVGRAVGALEQALREDGSG